MSSLVIAAHGTRLPEGQQACRALIERGAKTLLPGVTVYDAYVELDTPTIADAVAAALAELSDDHVVVVPLMIGTGGHVRDDIPEGIEGGRELAGSGSVSYAQHLGSDPLLRAAARERIPLPPSASGHLARPAWSSWGAAAASPRPTPIMCGWAGCCI